MTSPPHFAAIDVGSLTVRLAVAEYLGPGRFRVLTHRREVTGLGQDLSQTGLLAPAARDRTRVALRGFMAVLAEQNVPHYRAVGTQALRQAANRDAFLARLRDELNLTVEVLAPEAEARLALQGVLSALAPRYLPGPLLVFDVGGGSSEFALVLPGAQPRFYSLPLGVLTLSQAHPLGDPPEPERVQALSRVLESQLRQFFAEILPPDLAAAPPRLVGTAGAVTTLAAMSLKLAAYDPEKINNLVLSQTRVEELARLVAGLPEAARARLPGLEPAKAGVMVAGAYLVLAILRAARAASLVVVDAGLLEGVLQEMSFGFPISRGRVNI